MSTSSLQKRVSELLSTHLAKFTIRENIRPDWLLGLNGERLELDFLIEELNAAIEVQGRQHYSFIEFFHGDENGFHDQLVRDRAKREACRKNNIRLFEVASENDAVLVVSEICDSLELGIEDAIRLSETLKMEITQINSSMVRLRSQFESIYDYMKVSLFEKQHALSTINSIISKRKTSGESNDSHLLGLYALVKRLHSEGRASILKEEWVTIDAAQEELRRTLNGV